MVSFFKSPAGHDIASGMIPPSAQYLCLAVGFKMILENFLYNAWFHVISGGSPGLISALHSFRSSSDRFSPNSSTISSHTGVFLMPWMKFRVNPSEKASFLFADALVSWLYPWFSLLMACHHSYNGELRGQAFKPQKLR